MKKCHLCCRKLPKAAKLKIGGWLFCMDCFEELKPGSWDPPNKGGIR